MDHLYAGWSANPGLLFPVRHEVHSRTARFGSFTGCLCRGSPAARIWSTPNPHYWTSLDPARMRKHLGLALEVGRLVSPVVTPDAPERVEQVIHEHTGLSADTGGRAPASL